MSQKALETRIQKMTKIDKLETFAYVAEIKGNNYLRRLALERIKYLRGEYKPSELQTISLTDLFDSVLNDLK